MERWRYCALSEFNSITLPPIIVCVGLNFLTELLPDDLPGDPDFFCLGSVWASRGAGERSTITLLEEDSDSTEDDFSSTWDIFLSTEEDFVAEEEEVDSEKEEEFTSKEE